jgi:hypothetical protein
MLFHFGVYSSLTDNKIYAQHTFQFGIRGIEVSTAHLRLGFFFGPTRLRYIGNPSWKLENLWSVLGHSCKDCDYLYEL